MRELKDYFCTYEQTQELLKLGIKFDSLAYYFNHEGKNYFASSMDYFENKDLVAPLRSQALDYFRELGYSGGLRGTTPYNWYLIERPDKAIMSIKSGNYVSHVHCESALIDKLIELEKEARNVN